MATRCDECKTKIPLYKFILKVITCSNCGQRYKADDWFSTVCGVFGLALAGLSTLNGYLAVFSLVLILLSTSLLQYLNVFQKYLKKLIVIKGIKALNCWPL